MTNIRCQWRGPYCIAIILIIIIQAQSYVIRPATEKDVSMARKLLLQEKMNPLSISTQTMLVASEESDDDDRNSGSSSSNDYPPHCVLGFGQIRPLNGEFSELASLYVLPEYRRQGIGSGLVKALLQRHQSNKETSKVCLLTLKPTSGFYKSFGFQETTDEQRKSLPNIVQAEYMAGKALSAFLGNKLVCMIQS